MKVCMFHLMPYRDLPPDFGERYQSAYIDPVWFDVADPDKVGQYYNWTLDEFVYAANAGIHPISVCQATFEPGTPFGRSPTCEPEPAQRRREP